MSKPLDVAALARVNELRPDKAEMQSLPGAVTTPTADGGVKVTISGAKGLEAFKSARKAYGAASAAFGAQRCADMETVEVFNPHGVQMRLPATQERNMADRGFRPRITGRRTRITSESEIRARIVAEGGNCE